MWVKSYEFLFHSVNLVESSDNVFIQEPILELEVWHVMLGYLEIYVSMTMFHFIDYDMHLYMVTCIGVHLNPSLISVNGHLTKWNYTTYMGFVHEAFGNTSLRTQLVVSRYHIRKFHTHLKIVYTCIIHILTRVLPNILISNAKRDSVFFLTKTSPSVQLSIKFCFEN